MLDFDFTFRGSVFFGRGKRNILNQIIAKENFNTACIVIDHALVNVQIFNDFLFHVCTTIDKKITSEKRKRNQDKYIIMRQNLINYLIANERKVTSKLYR